MNERIKGLMKQVDYPAPEIALREKMNYLRSEIEHRGIYRCNVHNLPAKSPGKAYSWQFYLRRCLYNPQFAFTAAELLVDKLSSRDVQIGACEDAGVTLGMAMATILRVPMMTIKKSRKSYGLLNFTEGPITGLPILLVDDLAGSQTTLRQARYTLTSFKLPITTQYATLINKTEGTHPTYLEDMELINLFTCKDFTLEWRSYLIKYGKEPNFGQHF